MRLFKVEITTGNDKLSTVMEETCVEALRADPGRSVVILNEVSPSEIRAEEIRRQRETECFPIINRGKLWYNKLTEGQAHELESWYRAWLDAPTTLYIPQKPYWLN